MATNRLTGMLFAAWTDCDRVLAGIDPDLAVQQFASGSSFAWTLAHMAEQLDSLINVRFAQQPRHPLIGQTRFRAGGSGAAESWHTIVLGVAEVRATARDYLASLADREIDRTIPYDGSLVFLRETGINLGYAVLRVAAHHYLHIGEIATRRGDLSHIVGDFPGQMTEAI